MRNMKDVRAAAIKYFRHSKNIYHQYKFSFSPSLDYFRFCVFWWPFAILLRELTPQQKRIAESNHNQIIHKYIRTRSIIPALSILLLHFRIR